MVFTDELARQADGGILHRPGVAATGAVEAVGVREHGFSVCHRLFDLLKYLLARIVTATSCQCSRMAARSSRGCQRWRPIGARGRLGLVLGFHGSSCRVTGDSTS